MHIFKLTNLISVILLLGINTYVFLSCWIRRHNFDNRASFYCDFGHRFNIIGNNFVKEIVQKWWKCFVHSWLNFWYITLTMQM